MPALTSRPRVLIADDHEAVARYVYELLSAQCDVVGSVRDGRQVLEATASLRPDVVLLDLSMPHVNGLDLLRQLKRLEPAVKVIIVTMYSDEEVAQEALKSGAAGFVLKSEIGQELLPALDAIVKGDTYLAGVMRPRPTLP